MYFSYFSFFLVPPSMPICFDWILVEETNKIDELAAQISIQGAEATPLTGFQNKSFVKKYNARHFVSAKSLQFSTLVKVKC